LRGTIVTRRVDRLRRARGDLDPLCLNQQVDDERTPGLTLAVQTVATVNDQRLGKRAVPDGTARAAALTVSAHAAILRTVSLSTG